MPTNHGSIEFLKFPDPQYPGDTTRLIKKWLRDSWARRKIATLQSKFATVSGTLVNGFSSYVAFPSGYTLTNCAICGLCIQKASASWRSGEGLYNVGYRIFASMDASGIQVYNDAPDIVGLGFVVTLVRTDI